MTLSNSINFTPFYMFSFSSFTQNSYNPTFTNSEELETLFSPQIEILESPGSCEESSIFIEHIKTLERLEKLNQFYYLKNPQKIKEFLLNNKDLIDILEDAPNQIFLVFGKNIKLELELYKDIEEGWEELFIIIKSKYPPKKAFELERKLFNNWFKQILYLTKGNLNFTETPL